MVCVLAKKEPAYKTRARNLATLIRSAEDGEINENLALSKLEISPRIWRDERVRFFDTHPEFSYEPETRMIYVRAMHKKPEQATIG